MNENIKDLVSLLEEQSKDRFGTVQQAYLAGYYESMLSHLMRTNKSAATYIETRVDFLRRQSTKVA
jgi:hypothetical protein